MNYFGFFDQPRVVKLPKALELWLAKLTEFTRGLPLKGGGTLEDSREFLNLVLQLLKGKNPAKEVVEFIYKNVPENSQFILASKLYLLEKHIVEGGVLAKLAQYRVKDIPVSKVLAIAREKELLDKKDIQTLCELWEAWQEEDLTLADVYTLLPEAIPLHGKFRPGGDCASLREDLYTLAILLKHEKKGRKG